MKVLEAQRYDLDRSIYYQDFLHETLKAIHWDGVNVIGALCWSYVDDDEFSQYYAQFGLQTINRTSGKFEQTYKRSFFDLVDFYDAHIEK